MTAARQSKMWSIGLLITVLAGVAAAGIAQKTPGPAKTAVGKAPVMGYEVVATLPHSTESYTEGFFYRDGLFYEGTGLEGHSKLMAIEPKTGKVVRSVDLPSNEFGEGIIDWGNLIYEWTWESHTCFVYTIADFHLVKVLRYDGEGWGMTRTNDEIVTSDGTPTLTFRDPETFQPTHAISVHDGDKPIKNVNELEYVKGEILANIWQSDRIAKISPKDGHVIAWVDLGGLKEKGSVPVETKKEPEYVLNGIAYDAEHDRLYVTGKQWGAVFQIKVVKKGNK
jgi:glutaminyl-peptide cyclotransferase